MIRRAAYMIGYFASSIILLTISTQALSFNMNDLKHGHTVLQLGGYLSSQGEAQHINIQGLIGDNFSVTKRSGGNGLVGLGYLVDGKDHYFNGQERYLFKMTYGINAFYLGKTPVSGTVTQENMFTNLSYGYNVSHFPVYAAAKATVDLKSTPYALTVDAGIGPNFITTSGFQERSLDGITLPDRAFSGHTTTTFSAMVGVGLKVNHVFGDAPLECGYRFFYLGQGNFNTLSNQITNSLSTGSNYANALVCSVTV